MRREAGSARLNLLVVEDQLPSFQPTTGTDFGLFFSASPLGCVDFLFALPTEQTLDFISVSPPGQSVDFFSLPLGLSDAQWRPVGDG